MGQVNVEVPLEGVPLPSALDLLPLKVPYGIPYLPFGGRPAAVIGMTVLGEVVLDPPTVCCL